MRELPHTPLPPSRVSPLFSTVSCGHVTLAAWQRSPYCAPHLYYAITSRSEPMGSSNVTGELWASGADMLDSGPGLYSARSSRRGSLELGRASRPPQLWERALQAVQSEEPVDGRPSLEEDTEHRLRQMMQNGAEKPKEDAIPQFFKQKPAATSLAARIQRAARSLFYKQKEAESLLDQRELEQLWGCLRENRTLPEVPTGDRINYDDFCQVAAVFGHRVGPRSLRYFSAATFLIFEADDFGRIAILPFYLYVMRWVSMAQTRIDMCLLDSDADGSLLPQELEAYIAQLVPNLRLLQFMDPAFLSLYCRIAARKFLFFCDPQRRGKLLIREVLLSPVLSELMELRQEGASEEEVGANWFSLQHTKAVYHEFVALDSDCSGALSREEVRMMNGESLTDLFIERVFDEQVRRSRGERGDRREMDLGCFLELLLALENKQTREGLAYIFRCLDLRGNGYLTAPDIYTFFRSVHGRWMEGGNYELEIEDVKDEIFDMVKPVDPLRMSLEDLVQCGQGHTVAAMLIDIAAFWAHDNRETLAAQAESDGATPG